MNKDLDQNQGQRKELLTRTSQLANEFLDGVADRPVARRVEFEALLSEINAIEFLRMALIRCKSSSSSRDSLIARLWLRPDLVTSGSLSEARGRWRWRLIG